MSAKIARCSLFSLKRKDALKAAKITHVVSALRLPLDDNLFQGYKHLVVEVDDVEEDDIIQHFPTSNVFIQQGLDGGGGVLVHWWVIILSLPLSYFYPLTPLLPRRALLGQRFWQ